MAPQKRCFETLKNYSTTDVIQNRLSRHSKQAVASESTGLVWRTHLVRMHNNTNIYPQAGEKDEGARGQSSRPKATNKGPIKNTVCWAVSALRVKPSILNPNIIISH